MFYPKQVPYLLNKEFQINVDYQEQEIEELKDYVMCFWSMQSKRICSNEIAVSILPDACIDIVIDFTNEIICFAGFSKETMVLELKQKIDILGVRLKPSSFFLMFHIEASEVMDHPILFEDIDSSDTLKNIFMIKKDFNRKLLLKDYLLSKVTHIEDKRMLLWVDRLYKEPQEQRVYEMAKTFGYHSRHLNRIFKKYYGVSPKVLLNILRLHLCLTLLLEQKNLMEIISLCGFYDQSHFIKEIKRYTGFSPLELIQN